jgi:hypothetical protein
MPSFEPIALEDFDPTTVSEVNVKPNERGGKTVLLKHGPGNPVVLQIENIKCPQGVRSWEADDGTVTYSMELVLEEGGLPLDKFEAMDERVVDIAEEGRWLGKRCGKEVLRDHLYTHIVRVPKENGEPTTKWPKTMRIKIPRVNGSFPTEFYSADHAKIDSHSFVSEGRGKNSLLTLIVQCTHAWVAGGKLGTTWKAKQVLVHQEGGGTLKSFAFLNAPPPVPVAPSPPAAAAREDCETEGGGFGYGSGAGGAGRYTSQAPRDVLEDSDEDDR